MTRISLRINPQIVVSSVLALLFTLFATSVSVSAQDSPDFLLGNVTLEKNPTKEQTREAIDKVSNYIDSMKKEANGNETKFSVLIIEDLAKRNIIDEEAKQGFLSFIANIPKPPIEEIPGTTLPGNVSTPGPGTFPGNLTIPGNTDFLKDLDASSAMLDDIAKNNSDSQVVTLMTDIIKKKVTDIGAFVSGNGTDTGPVTIEGEFNDVSPTDFAKAVTCAAAFVLGGSPLTSAANGYYCIKIM